MELIGMIVIPGVLGGLLIALLIHRLHHQPSAVKADDQYASVANAINMARIRVAGVGGLGLVAMAAVVAWFVPRIGQTLLVGATLGLLLAAFLIMSRRRVGPLPSSGRRPGANSTLSIDHPMCSEDNDRPRSTTRTIGRLAPTWHVR